MVIACFFVNVGELEFGGGNRFCDASVWVHYVDSCVDFTDVVNIAFFQETVCCRPGVNYIYKIIFLGTISRVVLTFNFLGLTTLEIDAPPLQFAGPCPLRFWPDTQV